MEGVNVREFPRSKGALSWFFPAPQGIACCCPKRTGLMGSRCMVKKNWRLRWVSFVVLFSLTSTELFCQDLFKKGEDLFLRNKPLEAIPLLEQVYTQDPANVTAALYLGIAYQQVQRWDDAISLYRKVLARGSDKSALVAFHLGNAYFSKGSALFAEQYYSQALQMDGSFSSAYLNRANAYVKLGSLDKALKDYEQYLTLEPASPKRPQVEQMIALLKQEFAAAAAKKAAEEAALRAEEERRKKLLEEVSASLQSAAEETRQLQAGSEGVQGYEGEFELE